MPFKSKQQEKFLYSQKPDVAKEFEKHTTKKQQRELPAKVKKKKTS